MSSFFFFFTFHVVLKQQESFKYLAKHLTEKVVTAKVTANSFLMTDNTRSRISKLVYKTMHPHGVHHFIYDASKQHHTTEDDEEEEIQDDYDKPSPINP